MPLFSEPWAVPNSESSRLVALSAHLAPGVGQSLTRACFWLGPFTLGAAAWETLSTLPANVIALVKAATGNERKTSRRAFDAAMRFSTLVSQLACLAALSIYAAWTHGDPAIACNAWPRAFIGMSALAVSFAVAVFLLQIVKMARLPIGVICLIGFLGVAQLTLTLASIDSWHGGLRPSGEACYIRISRWFGIFSLLPLIAIFVAMTTLISGVSQERLRLSSSRRMRRPSGLPITPPVENPPPNFEKTPSQKHLNALYRSAGVEPPHADDAEQVDAIGQSFLKLSSEAGSIATVARHNERSFEALRRYGGWATPTALALLCGCILAFMDLSPILPLVYHPVLTVVPVLCANRLCSMPMTSTEKRGSSATHNSGSSGIPSSDNTNRALLGSTSPTRRRFQPLQLNLGNRGGPASNDSSIEHADSADSQISPRKGRAARFLVHHMSGQSLRAHFAAAEPTQHSPTHRGGHRPSGSVDAFVQRSGEISSPILRPSGSMRAALPAVRDVPDGFFRNSTTATTSSGRTPSPATMMRIRTDEGTGAADPWKSALLRSPSGSGGGGTFRSFDNLHAMQRQHSAGAGPMSMGGAHLMGGGLTSLPPGPRRKKTSNTSSKPRASSSRPPSDPANAANALSDPSQRSTAGATKASSHSSYVPDGGVTATRSSSQRDRDSVLSSASPKHSRPSTGTGQGRDSGDKVSGTTPRENALRSLTTEQPQQQQQRSTLAGAGMAMADGPGAGSGLAVPETDSAQRSSDRSNQTISSGDARHSSEEVDPEPLLLRVGNDGEGGGSTYRFSGPGRPLSMAFEPSAPRDGSIDISGSEAEHSRPARSSLGSVTKHSQHGAPGGTDMLRTTSSASGATRKPRILVPAPPRSTGTPSVRSISLADLDDDDLKQVIDSRGFAIDAAPGLNKRNSGGSVASSKMSREEQFAAALAQRKAEAEEEKRARKAQHQQQSGLLTTPQREGPPTAGTESSFGLRDIAGNPRLARQRQHEDDELDAEDQPQQQENVRKQQRKDKQREQPQPPRNERDPRKPFFHGILPMGMPEPKNKQARRRPSQLEDERKDSDGSNRSDPTAITSSSGGNSSGKQSSNSGSGSGPGNSSVSNDAPGTLRLVGRRVGVGERGALPEGSRIVPRIVAPQREHQAGRFKAAGAPPAAGAGGPPSTAVTQARTLRNKGSGSVNGSSEGGQSNKSRDTFGGSFGARSIAGSL